MKAAVQIGECYHSVIGGIESMITECLLQNIFILDKS